MIFLQLNEIAQRKVRKSVLDRSNVKEFGERMEEGQGNEDNEFSGKRATEVMHPGVWVKEMGDRI